MAENVTYSPHYYFSSSSLTEPWILAGHIVSDPRDCNSQETSSVWTQLLWFEPQHFWTKLMQQTSNNFSCPPNPTYLRIFSHQWECSWQNPDTILSILCSKFFSVLYDSEYNKVNSLAWQTRPSDVRSCPSFQLCPLSLSLKICCTITTVSYLSLPEGPDPWNCYSFVFVETFTHCFWNVKAAPDPTPFPGQKLMFSALFSESILCISFV